MSCSLPDAPTVPSSGAGFPLEVSAARTRDLFERFLSSNAESQLPLSMFLSDAAVAALSTSQDRSNGRVGAVLDVTLLDGMNPQMVTAFTALSPSMVQDARLRRAAIPAALEQIADAVLLEPFDAPWDQSTLGQIFPSAGSRLDRADLATGTYLAARRLSQEIYLGNLRPARCTAEEMIIVRACTQFALALRFAGLDAPWVEPAEALLGDLTVLALLDSSHPDRDSLIRFADEISGGARYSSPQGWFRQHPTSSTGRRRGFGARAGGRR